MKCDSLDWSLCRDGDYVLWFRTHKRRHHWRASTIGSEDVCQNLASEMARRYPRRSILILPKHKTPVLEVV